MYRVKKIGVLFLVAALGCSTGVFRGATKLYAAESGMGGEIRVVTDTLRVEQGEQVRIEVDSVAKENKLMGSESAGDTTKSASSERSEQRGVAEMVSSERNEKRGVAERGSVGGVVESERGGRSESTSGQEQREEQEVLLGRELMERVIMEEEGETREEVKYVSAEKMFGERSSVVLWSARDVVEKREEGVLTENVYFKGALLICFIIFCLILYFYRGQASKLFEIVRKGYYIERVLEEQNYLFDKFANLLILVGMIGQSLFFVKLAEMYLTGAQEREFPQWVMYILVPAGVVMLTAVLYYQLGVIAVSGRLSGNERFAQSLSKMHRVMAALVAMMTTPIILMFALSDGVAMMVLLYIIIAIAIGALIFLIIRTLKLFIEKKISILYWFLYLCIVGVFPLSFLALLLLRSI